MSFTNFPNGLTTSHIVSAQTMNTTGRVYYVNNSSVVAPNGIGGSDTNSGLAPTVPFRSLSYAISRCIANRGDIIYLMPGHIEEVMAAAGIDCTVAGITIVAMGEGSNKATIKFSTAITSDLDITADNVAIVNVRFVNDIDNLTAPIDVNAANFRLVNPEFVDAASKNTIRWVLADANADGLDISGVSFDRSDEAGTQKVALIDVGAATNVKIKDVEAIGNFSSGVIVNPTAWVDAILSDVLLENTSASPNPALVLQAGSSGHVIDSKLTIASGTTYHSASNMQFFNSFGSNANGGGTEELGSIISGSVEGKIGNIIDAIYSNGVPGTFPSAIDPGNGATVAGVLRSVHVHAALIDQNLTGVAGIVAWPVAATPASGVSIAQVIRDTNNGVNSMLAASSVDNGLSFTGTCDAGMVASTTSIVSAELAGFGNDFFNSKYYMQVIKNNSAVGTAPEFEIQQITDYVSGTGTFTTNAFTVNVEANDEVLVLHESLVMMGRDDANNVFSSANVVANVDGSVFERLEDLVVKVTAVDDLIDTEVAAIQTDIGDPSARANFSSIETMIGVPDAVNSSLDDMLRTGFDSTAVGANIDGSVMERLEDIVVKVTAVDDYIDTEVSAIKTETDQIGTIVNTAGTATIGGVFGDFANVTLVSRLDTIDNFLDTEVAAIKLETDQIGTIVNTAGTATIGGALGDMANVSVATRLGAFGTLVNTGGTPTLGGILGDVNNVSIASSLSSISTDTNKIEDAALSGTPTANSLSRFIATGGVGLGSELPVSKSLYDEIQEHGDGYLATKTITYDGSATYAAFTVSGSVRVEVYGRVDTALSNVAGTTSVGTATNASGIIAATAGSAMQNTGNIWVDNAPSNLEAPPLSVMIGNGEDIVLAGGATLAAGVVTLYCYWKPRSAGATVVAA